jgi:hypothetical protein
MANIELACVLNRYYYTYERIFYKTGDKKRLYHFKSSI